MSHTQQTPYTPSLRELLTLLTKKKLYIPEGFCEEKPICSVATDSRKVVPGGLFIAVSGSQTDGWTYLTDALEKGAKLVVGSKELSLQEREELASHSVAYLCVPNSREAVSLLAPAFFGFPAESLRIVGVTGTNGKTTTTTLLYQLFTQMGYRCGLIGTIENRVAETVSEAKLTTPDAISLQELFYEMKQAGCEFLFMEVSSHALAQSRTEGINFEGAVFTNLSRDHLDYHGDMLSYQKAKKLLFDGLASDSFALLNGDERATPFLLQNCQAKKYTYGIVAPADFHARIIERDFDGTELLINNISLWVKLTGLFNMYNLLAVYGTAKLLLPHLSEEYLLTELSRLDHARGRFEVIRNSHCTAIVDYAHTPDALIKVLDTIAAIAPKGAKIFTVIGAGGDRDKGKRPLMAQATYSRSDRLILTSDNPRNEDPEQILADMLEGLSPTEQQNTLAITSRREAIKTAILLARPQDIVLVAGKGHETYQEIKGIRHHFDDSEEIKNLFTACKATTSTTDL